MSRRGDTRDRDPRDDRNRRGDPGREPAPRQARPRLNEFFVEGSRIHREVMQREICKFLGPEAYSKPHSYNGVKGYLVSAIRPFTPDQLDDLQELSEAYESENQQMRRKGHPGVPYQDSEVSRRQDASLRHADSSDMMDTDTYYSSQPPYTMASAPQGYPALSSGYAQPSAGAYTPSPYSSDTGYPLGSAYPSGYAPSGSTRPGENYTYGGNESPRNDPYRQPAGYAGGTQRPGPGRNPDPREPRQDPRYAPSRDPRMDPRDPRDLRTMQPPTSAYAYTSAGDVGSSYIYAPPPNPTPSGRGMEPYAPPRAPVYDPYRQEPIRDVRSDPRGDDRRRR